MNKEELNKLQEVINDQLDLIEMNVARINNKDYFGLDFELLKYIRNLENQLDIANKKLDEIRKFYLEHETLGMNNPFEKRIEELRKILSIIGDK